MKIRERVLADALLLGFALCFLALSLRLTRLAGGAPMVVAAMTSLLVLAQLAMDVRKQEEAAGGAGREREERRLMLLLGVWLVAIYLAGFSIALPLCAGYYWRTRAGASWPATLAAAAAAVALLEGVLGKALGIGLYPGALSEWMLP